MQQRVFDSRDFFVSAPGEPLRTVVTESADAVVVAWHVEPGQRIAAHVHPQGQDTWTILEGEGDYFLDNAGAARRVGPGDIAVARRGQVHGVFNSGTRVLRFVSVVCPANAGYERL